MYLKNILRFFSAFALLSFYTAPVFATTPSFSSYPKTGASSSFEYTVNAGLTIFDKLEVKNLDSKRKIKVKLSGLIDNAAGYVSFDENMPEISADGKKEISFSINLPYNLCKGDYKGLIAVFLDSYDGSSSTGNLSAGFSVANSIKLHVNTASSSTTSSTTSCITSLPNLGNTDITSAWSLPSGLPFNVQFPFAVSTSATSSGSGGGGGSSGGGSFAVGSSSPSTVAPTTNVTNNISTTTNTSIITKDELLKIPAYVDSKTVTYPNAQPAPQPFIEPAKFEILEIKPVNTFEEMLIKTSKDNILKNILESILDKIVEDLEVSDGIIDESSVLSSEENDFLLMIDDNVLKNQDDSRFSGKIEISTVANVESFFTESNAQEAESLASKIYSVGPEDSKIYFEKPITLMFDVSQNFSPDNFYVVKYFNPYNKEWKLVDVGDTITDDQGRSFVKVNVSHLTDFAVFNEEPPFCDFEDAADHWSKLYMKYFCDRKIVNGYESLEFKPDNPITRAEFLKIVLLALDIKSDAKNLPFTDVKNHWILPYARIAKEKNIIGGYKNGSFKPDKSITRSEALKILLEAKKIDLTTDFAAEYEDIERNAWYMKYLNFAVEKGIVKGYEDSTFRPLNNISRSESLKIVYKIIKALP